MTRDPFSRRLTKARGILFDLDNTLYPKEAGVFEMIRERISRFVASLTGLGPAEVHSLRQKYIRRYGTTLGGLIQEHCVDPEQFLDYVHDVPVEELLQSDRELDSFLASIELPKIVFTNSSLTHAKRTLDILGVEHHFQGICHIASTGYIGKPHRSAFDTAAGMLSLPLSNTLFLDDVAEYVKAGKGFGALAVKIGTDGNRPGDLVVEKVIDLSERFEGLPWYNATSTSKA